LSATTEDMVVVGFAARAARAARAVA